MRLTKPIAVLLVSLSLVGIGQAEVTTFVEPYRDIDVSSPEMGTLADLRVQEGDVVTKGQVLATLDESVLKAAIEIARTAKESRGKLRSAEVELRLQIDRLEKLEGLRERRHATDEELQRARAQKEIAAAQVQAVRDELQVKAAEFLRIKAQLEQRRIKSPIQGTVTQVFKDAGEFVSASEPVVVKVVQLNPLRAVFSVPVADARSLKVDQLVPLGVGAARVKAEGIVEFVSPTADAQSGTVRVKVRIPNDKSQFQSGDGCWLQIATSASEATKAVPTIHTSTSRTRPE